MTRHIIAILRWFTISIPANNVPRHQFYYFLTRYCTSSNCCQTGSDDSKSENRHLRENPYLFSATAYSIETRTFVIWVVWFWRDDSGVEIAAKTISDVSSSVVEIAVVFIP